MNEEGEATDVRDEGNLKVAKSNRKEGQGLVREWGKEHVGSVFQVVLN